MSKRLFRSSKHAALSSRANPRGCSTRAVARVAVALGIVACSSNTNGGGAGNSGSSSSNTSGGSGAGASASAGGSVSAAGGTSSGATSLAGSTAIAGAGSGGLQNNNGGASALAGSSALGGTAAGGAENAGGARATGGGGGAKSAGGAGGKANAGAGGASGANAMGGAGAATSGGASGAGPERCTQRAAIDASKWKLVWSDEFDKPGAPDPSNWGFEKGFVRNQELQWYQPDNASVAGGLLTIAAQKQQVTNPNYNAGSSDWKQNRQFAQYTSSSLTSSGKRSFLYGRFEMCGQIDTRQGSWPAFWILGNGRSWPSSGEVDIMEYYANGVRSNICKPSGSTCDWSGSVSQSLSSLGGSAWSNEFHLWAMEWDAKSINLYLDDKLVYGYSITSANPYTGNAFYVLVNLAIGANGGDPSGTTFPIAYQVDYVRVYQTP